MFKELNWKIKYPLVSVTVVDTRTGLTANGNARCDPTDQWDAVFGADLALSRAVSRVNRKKERNLIRRVNAGISGAI